MPEVLALTLLLIFLVFTIIVSLIVLSFQLFALFKVPFVPTRGELGKEMFELAGLKKGETVVDFGCGDGALLFEAVENFGAKGIGYEAHPMLVWWTKKKIRRRNLEEHIRVERKDFFKADLPEHADVIATYLLRKTNKKLEPRLKAAYPSGTRLVSRAFQYPTLKLIEKRVGKKDTYYLYQLP
mgnify:CR=1 FL=1